MSKMRSFLKFIFHASVIFLIIISLYPGSLLGFLFYQDWGRQPIFIENPLGATINHFIYYFYVSTLGLLIYSNSEKFQKMVVGLFFLSIALEILQFAIPNRTFQLFDLLGNFIGVLVAYFLVEIYLHYSKP